MIPKEILKSLREDFGFPDQPLMGQVATVVRNAPDIRTMRIYDLSESGCPILLSHKRTKKWGQFVENSNVAICFLNQQMSVQIVMRGKVTLTDGNSQYWDKMRADIKKIYDGYDVEDYFSKSPDLEPPVDVSVHFGLIKVVPIHWEVLFLASMDYPNSRRILYSYYEGQWTSQRVNVG